MGQTFYDLNHIKWLYCNRRFASLAELNVQSFSVCLLYQGIKAERGEKGDLGFRGDLVSLILPLDCSSLC